MRTIPCMLIAAEEVEHITEKLCDWFEMSIAGDATTESESRVGYGKW